MPPTIHRRKLITGAAAVAACAALPSLAQSDKPITLIVPAPPGGSNDVIGRVTAEAMASLLQRQVVVDNKAGGSGVIGFNSAVKGPHDGTTFVVTSPSLIINPWVMKKMPFDPIKDLSGVAGLAQSPLVLVAHKDFPVQSVRELKAALLREPARATFAAADNATLLATTQLLAVLGSKATIANYKGTVPAVTDVAGGHISLAVTVLAAAMPFARGGQVKVLGLLSRARLKALPDIPTLIEQGVDVEFQTWNALHASSQVPKAIVSKLSADLLTIVASPSFAARIENIYAAPLAMGARELDTFVAQQMKQMGQLASAAGLQPE